MKVWKLALLFLFFFLRLSSMRGEDTVAEDIGVHQLERLVELLTPKECVDLLFALSDLEENIFQHIEDLSLKKSQLGLKPQAKRKAPATGGRMAECPVTALTDWLQKNGEQTYYDRVSRALQHIGRTDIAIEVEKNINQEKALNMKRYVEDYHKYVESLKQPEIEEQQPEKHTVKKRKVRDLMTRDMELIVKRAQVVEYQKGPLDVALPILYGILFGFGITLFAGISMLFIIIEGQSWLRRSTATSSGLER